MLRIGLCDDVADARMTLRAALGRALERRGTEADFFEFSSGSGLLRWMGNHAGELDLLFLDVEMGEPHGMETARRLRAMDEGLQIVFVTGYADYVFDGYSVGALGYLMKPVKTGQLSDVLERCMEALCREGDRSFLCRSGDTVYRIPKKNILYFCSDRRKVSCVTTGRSYSFYGKLDQVERDAGAGFVRIHQRYLVRAAAVDRVVGGEVYLGETALPVSRAYQQTALVALTRAVLED